MSCKFLTKKCAIICIRHVFRNYSNIYDTAFCEKNEIYPFTIFAQKNQSYLFGMVLNISFLGLHGVEIFKDGGLVLESFIKITIHHG